MLSITSINDSDLAEAPSRRGQGAMDVPCAARRIPSESRMP